MRAKKCLVRVTVGGKHRSGVDTEALVGLTSVEDVTQSRSRERMAQVWPLTSEES